MNKEIITSNTVLKGLNKPISINLLLKLKVSGKFQQMNLNINLFFAVEFVKRRRQILVDLSLSDSQYTLTKRKTILRQQKVADLIAYIQSTKFQNSIQRLQLIFSLRRPLRKLRILKDLNQNQKVKIEEYKNQITKTFAKKIQNSKLLEALSITQSQITDDILQPLTKINFSNLYELDLSDNCLSHHAMKLLSNCQFDNLSSFRISSNPIGNKGLQYFCKFKSPLISTFDFYQTEITPEGVNFLKRRYLPKFNEIYFHQKYIHINCFRNLISLSEVNSTFQYQLDRPQIQFDIRYHPLMFKNEIAKKKHIQNHYKQKASSQSINILFKDRIVISCSQLRNNMIIFT